MKSSIFGVLIVGVALLMSGCVSYAEFGTEEYDDAWNELAKNSASNDFAHPIDLYLSEYARLASFYWVEATERREAHGKVNHEGLLTDLVASNGSLFWMETEPNNKIREVAEIKLSDLEGLVAIKGSSRCLLCTESIENVGVLFLFRNALGDLIEKSSEMDLEAYSEQFLPYLRRHTGLVFLDPVIGREWFDSEIVPQLPHPEVFQEPGSVQFRDDNAENIDFYALPSLSTPRVTAPTLDA
jgi:hypothetical protein